MLTQDDHFYVGPDDDPDKYRLLASVTHGGEGELWEADMVVAGGRERVAVKILREDHSADAARWTARWAEQVELLRLISHPGVVGVHAHFAGPRMHRLGAHNPDDRAVYLVMNWVDGQDLRDWVPQHTRPEDRPSAMRYLAQVATVLDWLHRGPTSSGRPLLHCDISPGNVIINRDGQAVLVDFGLIRVARHTTTIAAGTRPYMAPELHHGGEYGVASDRYAFGGLAYYVLTGTHPPTDPRQLHAGLATIAGFADQPANLAQLAAIFSPDPAARPSCTDWLRLLRLHSSTAPVRPTPLPPLAPGAPAPVLPRPGLATKPARGSRRKRAAVIAGAAVAAVVVLAITLINLVPGNANPGSVNPPGIQGSGGATPTGPSSVTAPRQPSPIYLTTLNPISSSGYGTNTWHPEAVTIDGRDYANSLVWPGTCGTTEIDYQLSGRYTRFQATAGLADDSSSISPTLIKILFDGKAVEAYNLQIRHPVQVGITTSGVIRLSILVGDGSNDFSCFAAKLAFADPVLERSP